MKKSLIAAFTLTVGLLGGCAMPAAPSGGTASATSSSGNTTAASEPAGNYRTVWVPPPTGSLLGGGYVRVANNVEGNDETALIGTINELNAAAGTPTERPFVVTAVSRSTGVSERELQVQQDLLQLQFGQLCAINAIAHGNSTKARELATLKSQAGLGLNWRRPMV